MKSLEEKNKTNMNMTNSIDNNKLDSISFIHNNHDNSELSKSFKKKMRIKHSLSRVRHAGCRNGSGSHSGHGIGRTAPFHGSCP